MYEPLEKHCRVARPSVSSEGIKPVAGQDNTIVQVSQIRKENLHYDVCLRCGFGFG